MPNVIATLDAAVEALLKQIPGPIVLGLPLGIGKPNPLVNALYRRIKADPSRKLTIVTALSLEVPSGKSELEQHFLQPLVDRVFKDYPDFDYVKDSRGPGLPPNIEVREFFFKTGDYLHNASAQQHYISTNYTFAARDLVLQGINVVAQAVGQRQGPAGWELSLSSNPDLTAEIVERCAATGQPLLKVAVINEAMPFMEGGACVSPDFFDWVVTDPAATHTLFAPPNAKVSTTDYAIGLHASSWVRDGGTLQIGIGSLGDAIAHALILRDRQPESYRSMLTSLCPDGLAGRELGRFEQGLYGCSEMFVNGFLKLMQAGIVRRRVFADLATQKAVNAGQLDPDTLPGGVCMTGGFFLGPTDFYAALRALEPAQRAQIDMTRIDFINQLDSPCGTEMELKRAQRVHARLMNTTMKVSLLGAAASDGLESGAVVSGVGGQYNFVAMGHALPDARSILMLRATKETADGPVSNIVHHYGHCTIPRHLRDVVITEYGVADLRGQSDAEVVKRLIAIADSRFQDELIAQAQASGKLETDWTLPERYRHNTPQNVDRLLHPWTEAGLLPGFPFGTDLTADELKIVGALRRLKKATQHPVDLVKLALRSFWEGREAPPAYLERLGLDEAKGFKALFIRKLFAGNL
ncbi:acetyl-CoA hydrolase/transferase C-terminal domain-containing protein [Inhella gelatinilytica]|uniref:Acetyl-CoA hydrolase n=1 Tax=Inhella gelatinilytica TaxID=2795030 RepID=A0A931NE47_9BURK|nr:acetyl-CoA hydrolase/transferase C-terminal domain-containing protein [Inhella gelatinilytica]MBH9552126.1 acetyl-CoA hydrolase [Inhella gelatinilytica]